MQSKLFAACLALVAFAAFAVPSLASASNTPLVVENGTPVATGTKIEGVNVGVTKMTTSLGTVECTTAVMTGTLVKNTTGTVEGTIETAQFGGTGGTVAGAPEPECTSPFGNPTVTPSTATNGLPWCLRSTSTMATDEFQLRGNGCTSAARPIRFALDVTVVGTCVYERSSAVVGSFTTSTTSSTLSVSEQEFPAVAGNPFGCPSSGKLDMAFQLRTSGGGTTLGVTS
jgi:hypothetical protein